MIRSPPVQTERRGVAGTYRWCRYAQPPANGLDAFGMLREANDCDASKMALHFGGR